MNKAISSMRRCGYLCTQVSNNDGIMVLWEFCVIHAKVVVIFFPKYTLMLKIVIGIFVVFFVLFKISIIFYYSFYFSDTVHVEI